MTRLMTLALLGLTACELERQHVEIDTPDDNRPAPVECTDLDKDAVCDGFQNGRNEYGLEGTYLYDAVLGLEQSWYIRVHTDLYTGDELTEWPTLYGSDELGDFEITAEAVVESSNDPDDVCYNEPLDLGLASARCTWFQFELIDLEGVFVGDIRGLQGSYVDYRLDDSEDDYVFADVLCGASYDGGLEPVPNGICEALLYGDNED